MGEERRLDLRRHLPSAAFVLVLLIVIAAFTGIFIYAGIYKIGADAPHSRMVYSVLDTLRERSIAASARGILVPKDLNYPKRVAMGAGLYDEMCTGCHLGPGLEKSEMSQGLYPPAPELALGSRHTPAQQFWIIKHGVKLSAMPAWGKTHNDELIWDMVAFLHKLPKMPPEQYKAAVASTPAEHDEMMQGMETDDEAEKPAGETLAEHSHEAHSHSH
jgi:mono/diheme cytochrome c family protein